MLTLLHHFLLDSADRAPDAPAVECGESTLDFSQLAESAARLAGALRNLGVSRGDRVMIFLDNSAEMVVAVFASAMAGAVFVPVNATTKGDKLAYLLADCEPKVLIAGSAQGKAVRRAIASGGSLRAILWNGQAPPGPAPCDEWSMAEAMAAPPEAAPYPSIDQDLACILYTSGSTGQAKGVMLTHRNVTNTAWAISTYLQNTPDDVVLCVMPLSFDYGLYQVLTGARVGFRVVIEKSFAYPWSVLERMSERRVTGLPGVPTVFSSLLELAPWEGLDLSALRYLTNTAASLPPAHVRRLRQAFPQARLYCMYGLTECTRVSWLDPDRLDEKIGSVGRAMPNSEAYVVAGDGRRAPPGTVGELVVRGSNVMRGYWRKPEATARRLRDGEVEGEKVLHTGDLFRADEEGFLFMVGRMDDVFKCRGEKVSPTEIERVLCEMEGVAEAAVVPVEHDTDGMAVKAVVVPGSGAVLTEGAVRSHCRSLLESHLVPRFVEIRAALPRSENGKVLRSALAGDAGAGDEAVPAVRPAESPEATPPA